MFEKTTNLTNASSTDQIVWIEPWCEEIKLPPGKTFEFKGRGIEDGALEIEERDGLVIVYGWPTCFMSVTCDRKTIWEIDLAVPSVPSGTTVKGFVKGLFHSND